MKIGLQLFSVRDSYKTIEEFKDVLRKIKEMGYEGVEFAGYAGMEANDLKSFLDEINLEPISSHHSIDEFDLNMEAFLEFDYQVGCRYVVCSYSPTSNMDEVLHIKQVLEKAEEKVKAYGMELAYHNHSNEFQLLEDGTIPIEHIKEFCKLELDTYWVFYSGLEPCHYMKESADVITLIHIKDGNLEGNTCSVGEGFNNISGIIKTAKQMGINWLIVENDHPIPDGLSDVQRCIRNIKL